MKSKVQIVRFDQIQFMDKYLSGIPTLWDCCKKRLDQGIRANITGAYLA